MYPVLFRWGPIVIYTYGFFVTLGIILGYILSIRIAKKEEIPIKKFSDVIFFSIVFGFIGSRLLYIIVDYEYFLRHPLRIIFSRSGFVFYGGFITGGVVFVYLCKRYKLDILKCADIAAIAVPLGHSIGRLGCFSYGCCYGRPTESWIGIKFPPMSPAGMLGTKVIPTQLISAFFLFLLFLTLVFIYKKKKYFKGEIFLLYVTLYSVFRFIIEFFRGDPRGGIGIFSTSQIVSMVILIFIPLLWGKVKRL